MAFVLDWTQITATHVSLLIERFGELNTFALFFQNSISYRKNYGNSPAEWDRIKQQQHRLRIHFKLKHHRAINFDVSAQNKTKASNTISWTIPRSTTNTQHADINANDVCTMPACWITKTKMCKQLSTSRRNTWTERDANNNNNPHMCSWVFFFTLCTHSVTLACVHACVGEHMLY